MGYVYRMPVSQLKSMCISVNKNARMPLHRVGSKPSDRGKFDVDKVLHYKRLNKSLVLDEVDSIIASTGVDMGALEHSLQYV